MLGVCIQSSAVGQLGCPVSQPRCGQGTAPVSEEFKFGGNSTFVSKGNVHPERLKVTLGRERGKEGVMEGRKEEEEGERGEKREKERREREERGERQGKEGRERPGVRKGK